MSRCSNCVAQTAIVCGLLWLATADLMAQQTPATSSTLDLRDQDKAAAEVTAEQVTAGKFFAVLLQRPRLGTALDRVYAHHLQAATLDEFLTQQIRLAQSGDQAGSRYLVIGLIERLRGNDAVAAEMIGQAESIRTDDAMASFYLGQALLAQGKTSDAATALQRAIEREPARVDALPVFKELARILVRQQKTDEALAVWTKLEGRFPDDSRVAEQIAAALADDDQLEPALARYEQLVKAMGSQLDDRTIGFGIQVAELKRRLGRDDEALRDFESLLARLRPSSWLYNDIRSRIELGFVRTGDIAALADYYAEQVTAHPDDVDLRLRWSAALTKSGRMSEAESALVDTTKLAPQNADARAALIDILVRLQKFPAAAEQLQTLVDQDPTNPDYLIRLGNLWLDDRTLVLDARRERAAAAWQQLARQRDTDPVITAQVAELMRRIDRRDDALRLFHHAIELAPDQPQYREYLGEYLEKLRRPEEALAAWRQIAAVPRDTRENLLRLAEVLYSFKHMEESLDVFHRAMQLDPPLADRLRFATLLNRAERFDEALGQLDLAEQAGLSTEERDQIWVARVDVYVASKTIGQRITDAQAVAEQSPTAESYRRLAMLLRANAQAPQALAAAKSAIEENANDVASLTLAAELSADTQAWNESIALYRRLMHLEPQFANSYRGQISSAQMRMNDHDAALATTREMIAAQPANPETYRLYAEQCFGLGRDEDGIATLRRALSFAPRDIELRHILATRLALNYRTGEAIEIRWQLLEESNSMVEQTEQAQELALLYERAGNFEALRNRLRSRERDASTRRQAMMLEAVAYRQVNDIGSALAILTTLIADHPHDAELLTELVAMCESAGQNRDAIEFQKQLTRLVDTPENHARLLDLLVKVNSDDTHQAELEAIELIQDPVLLIERIDRAIADRDRELAIKLCQATLQKNPERWEVRIRLAAMFTSEKRYEDALRELDTFDAMALSRRTPALTPPSTSTATADSALPTSQQLFQIYAFAGGDSLGSFPAQYSTPLTTRIRDGRDAKLQSVALRYLIASALGNLVETNESYRKRFADIADDTPDELKRETFWDVHDAGVAFDAIMLLKGDRSEIDDERINLYWDLRWRLIELDEQWRLPISEQLLARRATWRKRTNTTDNGLSPLTAAQFDILQATLTQHRNTPRSATVKLAALLYKEYRLAERSDDANQLMTHTIGETRNAAELQLALQFAHTITSVEPVEQIAKQSLRSLVAWCQSISTAQRPEIIKLLIDMAVNENLDSDTQLRMIDIAIAIQSYRPPGTANSMAISAAGQQSLLTAMSGIRSFSSAMDMPLWDDLLDSGFAAYFYRTLRWQQPSAKRNLIQAHLDADVALFPSDSPHRENEQRARGILSAYAQLWSGNITAGHKAMQACAERYPDDPRLVMEHARIASRLNRHVESIAALDAIQSDDPMIVEQRELMAAEVATRAGNAERLKLAAERLAGARLDPNLRIWLTRLFSQNRSVRVLGRRPIPVAAPTSNRKADDIGVLILNAERESRAGNQQVASEMAYTALQRISSDDRAQTQYRGKVLALLQTTGRLDQIVDETVRRVEAAPQSLQLKTELAELYDLAGRPDDASRVYAEIKSMLPDDPEQLMRTATALLKNRRSKEALDLFIAAITKDPTVVITHANTRTLLPSLASSTPLYYELAKLDTHLFDAGVVSTLSQYAVPSQRTGRSDGFFQFVEKLVSDRPSLLSTGVLSNVATDAKLTTSASIRRAVLETIKSDAFFNLNSPIWSHHSQPSPTISFAFVRSNQTTFVSPFETIAKIILANHEATAIATASLESRLKSKPNDSIAAAILLSLDAHSKPAETVAARLDMLIAEKEQPIPPRVWSSVAPVISESTSCKHLSTRIYQYLRDAGVENSPEVAPFAIGERLFQCHVRDGNMELARKSLRQNYLNLNKLAPNLPSSYLAAYRMTQTTTIAEQMAKIGSRLDCVELYHDLLSDPSLERLLDDRGIGGGLDFSKNYLSKAIAALTMQDCVDFLNVERVSLSQEKGNRPENARFDLVAMTTKPDASGYETSLAKKCVSELAATESGLEELARIEIGFNDAIQQSPRDYTLQAVRTLIAIELNRPDATEQVRRLNELLPPPNLDTESEFGTASIVLSLHTVAIGGLASADVTTRDASVDLTRSLLEFARLLDHSDMIRTLSLALIERVDSHVDRTELRKTLREMLNEIVSTTEVQGPVINTTATRFLDLAKRCAKVGVWDLAMESIRHGFAGGPPVRLNRSTASGSYSAVINGAVVSIPFIQQQTNDYLPLETQQLNHYCTELSSLFKPFVDDPNSFSDDDAANIYTTLVEVVLPSARPTQTFPYFEPPMTVSDSLVNVFAATRPSSSAPSLNEMNLNPPCLASALAIAASRTGKMEELTKKIDSREPMTLTEPAHKFLRLQLAIVQGERELYEQELDALARRLGVFSTSPNRAPLSSSLGNDERIMLLYPTLQIHRRDGRTPLVAEIEAYLVKMSTVSYEISSYEPYLAWITSDTLASKDATTEQVAQIIEDRLSGLRHSLSRFGAAKVAMGLANEAARLAPLAINAGRFDAVGRVLRFDRNETSELEKNLAAGRTPELSFLSLDPEVRFRCWYHVVLGADPDGVLALMPNLVFSAEAPTELRSVIPNHAIAKEIPVASREIPLHSSALVLIDAAMRCGRVNELLDGFRQRVIQPGDEADSLVGLTLLADGRTDEAAAALDRVFEWLRIGTDDKGLAVPMPVAAMLLAIRAGEVPSLRKSAARLWPLVRKHAERRGNTMTLGIIDRMLMQLDSDQAESLVRESPVQHWVATASTTLGSPMTVSTLPIYSVDGDRLRVAANWHHEVLMLKYPLAGDFTLTSRRPAKSPEQASRIGDGHSLFGAAVFCDTGSGAASQVAGLGNRGSRKLLSNSAPADLDHKYSLSVDRDVVMKVDDIEFARDQRTTPIPFVGFYFDRFLTSDVADIEISGNPTIPREVAMIDAELRGWSTSILAGELIEPLYVAPRAEPSPEAKTLRAKSIAELRVRQAWYAHDGELHSGGELLTTNPGGQRHLQYSRPLLSGESIEYEFFHEPGKYEVHPSLGRVAILLRDDGVKLCWLPQTRSLESIDMPPLGEASPSELVGDGKPKLRTNQWNRIRLTLEDDKLTVTVNDHQLGRFNAALDRRFGVLGEQKRRCRIRAMKLTGPWPETLPDDLMQLVVSPK